MHFIRNKAPGPRVFNLKVGAKNAFSQRLLLPGEVAEMDLLLPPHEDPGLKAWLDSGQIEIVDADAMANPTALDMDALAAARAKHAEATAELAKLEEDHATAAMDASRRTPPRQLGGDGGPEQMPTVDGMDGAPTASQEEAAAKAAPKKAAAPAAEKPAEKA